LELESIKNTVKESLSSTLKKKERAVKGLEEVQKRASANSILYVP